MRPQADGSQLFAYDMGVEAWDSAGLKWNPLLPDKAGDRNDHWRVWGETNLRYG
jgi:hypothetical protein